MQAQCKVFRKQHRATPTEERRPSNFGIFVHFGESVPHRSYSCHLLDAIGRLAASSHAQPLSRPIAPYEALLVLLFLLLSPAASAQRLGRRTAAPNRCGAKSWPSTTAARRPRPDLTRIHRFAEMPLNYFGFVLTYWDINTGLPSAERAANVRGIITWFRRAQPTAFYAWAQRAGGARRPHGGDRQQRPAVRHHVARRRQQAVRRDRLRPERRRRRPHPRHPHPAARRTHRLSSARSIPCCRPSRSSEPSVTT